MNNILDDIKTNNIGKILTNVCMKDFTTYKVGGNARYMIYPKDINSLINLMKLIKKYNIRYKVIGNGSNILFSDNDYNGIIIKLDDINDILIKDNTITVGAGYNLMKLAALATRNSLTGLEFATGIPGTVGGAIFMNAGAYKSDMGYVVSKVKVLTPDLKIKEINNADMQFHYRTSFIQKNKDYICLEATFELKYGDKESMEKIIQDRKERRLLSQPLEYPSAGSVFRNPDDLFAGQLIEDLGLKGKIIGGAQISPKHANFIVNIGNAKAVDIKDLILLVSSEVEKKYNIKLKVEQEFVNWE